MCKVSVDHLATPSACQAIGRICDVVVVCSLGLKQWAQVTFHRHNFHVSSLVKPVLSCLVTCRLAMLKHYLYPWLALLHNSQKETSTTLLSELLIHTEELAHLAMPIVSTSLLQVEQSKVIHTYRKVSHTSRK